MALSPMMAEYIKTKEKYSDCILFYRLGDFYEMFFEDAKTVSRELELVLTGKACGLEERAPMCGIPHHAASVYISRLVNKGYKIAICEQLEDPKTAKGIVKRGVVKIVTPGTYVDENSSNNDNTYIMAVYEHDYTFSLAFSDISTGEFKVTSFKKDIINLMDEVAKMNPKEILLDNHAEQKMENSLRQISSAVITKRDFKNYSITKEELLKQFGSFQIDYLSEERQTISSVLLKYIFNTQMICLSNINILEQYEIVNFMTIDSSTRRNLELTENIHEKNKKGSLFWVLDKSATSMGSRVIRRWIEEPLLRKEDIELRLKAVEELYNSVSFNEDLRVCLKSIYDIERIVGKISNANVNAKDLLSLKASLKKIPDIKELLKYANSPLLTDYYKDLDTLEDVADLLEKSIKEEPSLTIKEGNLIKEGYNSDVDELRHIKIHGKEKIAALENEEREFTNIKSLRVGYNRVFGYYIEISKANLSLIPEGRYIRKQTLTNAERFITEDLKNLENKILGSEEKLINLEYDIFISIRNTIEKEIPRLKKVSRIISHLDALSSFALVALENNYVKPLINQDGIISIKEGRHPVVEKVLEHGDFIANDTYIDETDNELLLITGPNMAGKSTYMRQVALITLMAQIGSFVPAAEADISICDKIFTRIGASDDLAGGKSTFMVEMWEVSNILKSATGKSLVLLDEVGRGTSTYDGLSIAWSVIEYITKNSSLRCKTLFATHYHELVKLEGILKGVKNYSVAVKKTEDNIVFLRKIIEGGADESYGIEVAKLAGLPEKVLSRAKEILAELEGENKLSSSWNAFNADAVYDENNNKQLYDSKMEKKDKQIAKQKQIINDLENSINKLKKDIKNNMNSLKETNKPIEQFPKVIKEENVQMNFSFIEKDKFIKSISEIDILNLNPMEAMNKLYNIVVESKKHM